MWVGRVGLARISAGVLRSKMFRVDFGWVRVCGFPNPRGKTSLTNVMAPPVNWELSETQLQKSSKL